MYLKMFKVTYRNLKNHFNIVKNHIYSHRKGFIHVIKKKRSPNIGVIVSLKAKI